MIAKRLFDLVFAALGLLLLWPLFLLIAACIRWDSPGPVFFRQERVGRYGRSFRIHKFRTMRHEPGDQGPLLTLAGDGRITKVGAFLRQYKLDELPQLIDVVQGTMSLVGARPEVPQYVAHYPPQLKAAILALPPGITDLASLAYKDENQLLARSAEPERDYLQKILPEKLRCYEDYARRRSFWGDVRVILQTLRSLFA